MITLRRADERGHTSFDWLSSYHTFSFGDYFDPRNMGFRTLRVINDDVVKPGLGFGTHPHRDMEIVTYIIEGALQHKDSMGNGSTIRPGDVQRMSAGTGVLHSEFNPSDSETVRLLQIWILPAQKGLSPEYEQKSFAREDLSGRLRLVASPDGEGESVTIHQDARLHAGLLDPRQEVSHALAAGRHAWLQMARGVIELGETTLREGDGAAISDERELRARAVEPAEILLFDLA